MKRLFFGFDVASPWPEEFPHGRILAQADRHLTIAFLGECDAEKLIADLQEFPRAPFPVGLCGLFDHALFLPRTKPNVAAWRIQWLEGRELFLQFQKEFAGWLKRKGWRLKEHEGEFLSHVTIARTPFAIHEWKEAFQKRPLFIGNFNLYESLGSSRYRSCWSAPILAPFEEKEHTADIAFTVRGVTIQMLHLHAEAALSFHFPPLVDYFTSEKANSLEEIVQSLNAMIGKADQEIGCPLKAVSYHGDAVGEGILEWEMIVDV